MKIAALTTAFMAATAIAAPLAGRAVDSNAGDTSTTWTPIATRTYAVEMIDSSDAANDSPTFYLSSLLIRRDPEPRFSLSRWLLDQPQLSKQLVNERQQIVTQGEGHLTRRQGKPTETETKLRDFALKKDLIKVPDWKEILLAPVNALSKAITAPWSATSSKVDDPNEQGKQPEAKTEIVVLKGQGAGQAEVEESPHAEETFTQGDGWRDNNFRHGTWTSKSKDAGKNQGKPE